MPVIFLESARIFVIGFLEADATIGVKHAPQEGDEIYWIAFDFIGNFNSQ